MKDVSSNSRKDVTMNCDDVRKRACDADVAAYPPGPYRFMNREYLIIT